MAEILAPWRTVLPGGALPRCRFRKPPAFTVGVEEEYLVVDRETREARQRAARGHASSECEERDRATWCGPEFLRSQVEIGTPVCDHRAGEARDKLAWLRRHRRRGRRQVRPGADRRLHPSLFRLVMSKSRPTRSATTSWPASMQGGGPPAHDLRHARARRHRGRTSCASTS